ncbi:hypothetical protein IW146_006533 [Coemansia sp. RSA 922]|nr:hypothetical protein H4S03_006125 [Coemansia sp. S3946]KAJ2058681.1 hypothetical protein GGI08_003378 [Coemansia sp. S2]KAJ2066158.1 hypothetical protein GGH13_005824 [Coemansia sp. S155-1]KAJ2105780.1 hypothetical protein GGI16_002205 [Coemansia sp. S142-1]KAJ2109074.1 hypothetical protein IW146_006533 [Coemansia sp. RSA 922]KAJ2349839.1 hypothetical protein GGH92_002428 [Coemansia sp. RSA 2673]KAJ2411719.1 hypothetical protein GGF41_006292 [Coemansia sp. RSA 2531]
MRFIIAAATAVVAAIVAAEPAANPEPQPEYSHRVHGFAKRWSGYGTWGCGCPLYGGFGYGAGVGYGVGAGYGVGVGYGIGTGIYY